MAVFYVVLNFKATMKDIMFMEGENTVNFSALWMLMTADQI